MSRAHFCWLGPIVYICTTPLFLSKNSQLTCLKLSRRGVTLLDWWELSHIAAKFVALNSSVKQYITAITFICFYFGPELINKKSLLNASHYQKGLILGNWRKKTRTVLINNNFSKLSMIFLNSICNRTSVWYQLGQRLEFISITQ